MPIAEDIALDLQYVADVTVWDQGVFPLSEGTLPALDAVADQSDFAVVVLTPDDVTTQRGQTCAVPRDNVLFEPGFFMGRLGVERTYMVSSRVNSPTLPSDLAGITTATFAERTNGNLDAAVGPASTQIRQAMEAVMVIRHRCGVRPALTRPPVSGRRGRIGEERDGMTRLMPDAPIQPVDGAP